MVDDPKPEDTKKPNPALFIGPAVAIGASLFVVFISTRRGEDETPAVPPTEQATPAPSSDPVAEPAQFGQLEPQQPATPTLPGTPATTPGATAVSPDGSALSFSDDTLVFSAALPQGAASDPVLSKLRKDAEGYLNSKKAEAKEGPRPVGMPWEIKIDWKYTAKAGDIVSLFGTSFEYTGGAHPITRFDTHIARKTGQEIKVEDLMVIKRSPSPAMVIAMCEALKAAKQKRIGSATIFDEPITCAGPNANVNAEAAKLALAPSSQADRFGGIYAYFEPYQVGAYVEGPYELVIQQEVFAEDLRPEFKPLFAGTAPPIES